MVLRFRRSTLLLAAGAAVAVIAVQRPSRAAQEPAELLPAVGGAGVPAYRATILPQLDPGDPSEGRLISTVPAAVDDARRVTGSVGSDQGFVWTPTEGGMLLQPQFAAFADQAVGAGIDAAGNVVGTFLPVGAAFGQTRAFRFSRDGDFTPLPSLGLDLAAQASDVNNRGLIVGSSETAPGGPFGGPSSAVFWWKDRIHEIGGLGGFVSRAAAVNDRGMVVGFANTADAQAVQPFRWTRNRGIQVLPQLVAGVPALPADVNDAGLVVGRAGRSLFENEAVFWDRRGEIHVLPGLHDTSDIGVLGVNNRGLMVGMELTPEFEQEARLWFRGRVHRLQDVVVDLPPGYELREATDVNERGDIVASAAVVVGGQVQFVAVLLTPAR